MTAANESEGRVGGMPTPDAADEHTTLAPGAVVLGLYIGALLR